VIGSMISLGYYLRVIATIWMSPPTPAPVPATAPGGLAPIAGGSPEADALLDVERPARRPLQLEVTIVAVVFAVASVIFGIFPDPLFKFVAHAGRSLIGIF
jgi:NADH-quinone oxidoreductase subunit N